MKKSGQAVILGCALLLAVPGKECWAQAVTGRVTVGVEARRDPFVTFQYSPILADSTHPGPMRVSDTFFGSDKLKHFLLSAFIESVGISAMQLAGVSRGVSIGIASAVTAATGIGREVHDRRTKGLFSFGDLTWDALGAAAALLLVSHSQR